MMLQLQCHMNKLHTAPLSLETHASTLLLRDGHSYLIKSKKLSLHSNICLVSMRQCLKADFRAKSVRAGNALTDGAELRQAMILMTEGRDQTYHLFCNAHSTSIQNLAPTIFTMQLRIVSPSNVKCLMYVSLHHYVEITHLRLKPSSNLLTRRFSWPLISPQWQKWTFTVQTGFETSISLRSFAIWTKDSPLSWCLYEQILGT